MTDEWVPVEACTLPTAEQPLRVAEFDALFAVLLAADRRGPTWLRLRLRADAGVADSTADLTARESACCSFFAFEIGTIGPEVLVDVRFRTRGTRCSTAWSGARRRRSAHADADTPGGRCTEARTGSD